MNRTYVATPLLALSLLAPLAAQSQVSVAISIAPPPLPVYEQPQAPGDGYLWTPGYWAWNAAAGGYYWVPGTWVLAPRPGYLWTPGYWAYGPGGYRWHVGYWGLRVGFYGGIAYGFGYTGHGYDGGRWERGAFHYNAAVNNVSTTTVRNVYRTTVVNQNTYNVTRVSYNGGATGVKAQPTASEAKVAREHHLDATPNQVEHERKALRTPTQQASANHGAPQVAATPKPAALDAPGAVKASNPALAERAPDTKGKNPTAAATAAPARTEAVADKSPQDDGKPNPPPQAHGAKANAKAGTKAAQADARTKATGKAPAEATAVAQPKSAGRASKPQGGNDSKTDVKQARAPGEPPSNDRQRE